MIQAPGLGYVAHRRGRFVRHMLRQWVTDQSAWDDGDADAFADNLAEPRPGTGCVQMYRTMHLRERCRR